MWFISHAHLQLGPGEVRRRRCPVEIKAGPERVAGRNLGVRGAAGDCGSEGIQHRQGAKEPVRRQVAVVAVAAEVPHPGADWKVWRRGWQQQEPPKDLTPVADIAGTPSQMRLWEELKKTPPGLKAWIPAQ